MSGEAFGFMGLFETGVGDRDLDLVDSDSESMIRLTLVWHLCRRLHSVQSSPLS